MTNPLEPIVDLLADIMKKTEQELKNPSDKPLPPDLMSKVADLERMVRLYVRIHNTLLNVSHVDKKRIEEIIAHVPVGALANDRHVLERLAKVKASILEAKALLDRETEKLEATTEGKKRRAVTKRKKKFRGVGDQDSWKKL